MLSSLNVGHGFGSIPNEFLQVGFPSGISSVTITGDAAITTAVASVPEPTSITLLLSALAVVSLTRRKRIHL